MIFANWKIDFDLTEEKINIKLTNPWAQILNLYALLNRKKNFKTLSLYVL